MAEIKLTKNELRAQQTRLNQLERYLPTLKLKKAMLQAEVNEARLEIRSCEEVFRQKRAWIESFSQLLTEKVGFDLAESAKIEQVVKRYENIAGVEVPYFEEAIFAPATYMLFETPPWVDAAVMATRELAIARAKVVVAEEKKAALEAELREVSIRVNLFEKILIPRAKTNIKKIKVFLGDQELAAVGQAKVAKGKIEAKKLAHAH